MGFFARKAAAILTPIASVLVAIIGGILVRFSGPYYASAEALVVGSIWFVLFSGAPTLRAWLLTGHHRHRQPSIVHSNKQMLRKV